MRNRELAERRFAEFHRLYTQDFDRDFPIYLDLAGKAPGPVLEIGCQTGRVTARLAAAGHEVVGIDTHRPMLEAARDRVAPWPDHARVQDFDLRHRALSERFNVCFISLHSFNRLIDVEEQRLFLRHLLRSMSSPGIVALDLFYPLSFARPDDASDWRRIEREVDGRSLVVPDRREMLTPLLERLTQRYRIDGAPEQSMETHRRYIPPQAVAALLAEGGFDQIRWLEGYDSATIKPIDPDASPQAPFMVIAEL